MVPPKLDFAFVKFEDFFEWHRTFEIKWIVCSML
jgi:hypothetical protein